MDFASSPPQNSKVHPGFEPKAQDFATPEDLMESGSFRLMAENSVDVLCRLTMDMRCTYSSPSAAYVLGWTPEEMLSHYPHDLIHPDDMAIAKTAHARQLNEENCENVPLHRQGEKKGWELRLARDQFPVAAGSSHERTLAGALVHA